MGLVLESNLPCFLRQMAHSLTQTFIFMFYFESFHWKHRYAIMANLAGMNPRKKQKQKNPRVIKNGFYK